MEKMRLAAPRAVPDEYDQTHLEAIAQALDAPRIGASDPAPPLLLSLRSPPC